MLRIRKRLAESTNSVRNDSCDQRIDADAGIEGALTKVSRSSVGDQSRAHMDQTSVNVNAREPHTVSETSRHRKKKRLSNKSLKYDDNSVDIMSSKKKAKISKSNTSPVVEATKSVRLVNSKKLFDAGSEDSLIRKKKRKVDFDDVKAGADVFGWKNEFDSVADKIADTNDSAETPSTSLKCDLQHLEDSIVDDFAAVRNELSEMPIADLLQLKERLGAKIYDEVMFGNSKKPKVSKKKFARENKNRPMEMSSKRPVAVGHTDMQSKKQAFLARDPRFDDLSGEFNESYYQHSYGFLSDVKLREKQKLLKMLKKTKDVSKAAQLQQLITRMTQQEKAEIEREEKHRRERDWKKKEKEHVSQGKRPFFLKKSEKRKLELAQKFRKLEETGRLEQFIAKKKKKNQKTEHRSLPHT